MILWDRPSTTPFIEIHEKPLDAVREAPSAEGGVCLSTQTSNCISQMYLCISLLYFSERHLGQMEGHLWALKLLFDFLQIHHLPIARSHKLIQCGASKVQVVSSRVWCFCTFGICTFGQLEVVGWGLITGGSPPLMQLAWLSQYNTIENAILFKCNAAVCNALAIQYRSMLSQ